VQETVLPFEQVAVAVQPPPVGQTGQLIVPEVEPVQEPLWPPEQLELVALQVVPEQVTVEPSQQLAVQLDFTGRRPWAAASWACGWASTAGAGAKIAAQAAAAGSGEAEAAWTGREQNARTRSATPKISPLFISNPPRMKISYYMVSVNGMADFKPAASPCTRW
jgi:hypothetical protein